ncbi:relaxase/mobilization nuclease domain-containing protein [Parafilimonas sp.]|uniref:relaxase/mobilization nuclease domain-containing protein n=1 Tax=Parafilimonas sp. TaxID=1969739 RepID=UPI003F802530
MIGKITTGKSFRGCLLYCLNDKKQESEEEQVMKNRAEIILFNQCFGNQKELIEQFNAVRQLNPKLAKPVLHITLSLAISDQLSKDKLMEICEQCAKEMGFEKNQYIAVQHLDTKHPHLHIVANRVGFDKRTVNDSNNYKKMAAYCRKMELKYDLKQVLSPRLFLSKEQRLRPRHDERKQQIRQHVQKSLKASRSYHDFERLMKEKKYQVVKGRGIAFIDEKKVYVKGSDLGYSLRVIERILEQNKLKPNQKAMLYHRPISGNKSLSVPSSTSKSNAENIHYRTNELSKVMHELIKPERDNMRLPDEELLPKRRKQKKY